MMIKLLCLSDVESWMAILNAAAVRIVTGKCS